MLLNCGVGEDSFFFKFYFIFKLYIIVLVLPNIKMNPPQVFLPGESHGKRSLVGYSPQHCKEVTEHACTQR